MELIVGSWISLLITAPLWLEMLGASEAVSGIIWTIMFIITFVVGYWLDEADRADKERINQLFDDMDSAMYDLMCESRSGKYPMKNIHPLDLDKDEIEKDIEDVKRTVIGREEGKANEMHN